MLPFKDYGSRVRRGGDQDYMIKLSCERIQYMIRGTIV